MPNSQARLDVALQILSKLMDCFNPSTGEITNAELLHDLFRSLRQHCIILDYTLDNGEKPDGVADALANSVICFVDSLVYGIAEAAMGRPNKRGFQYNEATLALIKEALQQGVA